MSAGFEEAMRLMHGGQSLCVTVAALCIIFVRDLRVSMNQKHACFCTAVSSIFG